MGRQLWYSFSFQDEPSILGADLGTLSFRNAESLLWGLSQGVWPPSNFRVSGEVACIVQQDNVPGSLLTIGTCVASGITPGPPGSGRAASAGGGRRRHGR